MNRMMELNCTNCRCQWKQLHVLALDGAIVVCCSTELQPMVLLLTLSLFRTTRCQSHFIYMVQLHSTPAMQLRPLHKRRRVGWLALRQPSSAMAQTELVLNAAWLPQGCQIEIKSQGILEKSQTYFNIFSIGHQVRIWITFHGPSV
jgi:hypothetical protein